jgi:hypothetical protein
MEARAMRPPTSSRARTARRRAARAATPSASPSIRAAAARSRRRRSQLFDIDGALTTDDV